MKSFFGKHFLLLVLALFAAKIDRSAAFAGKGGGEFDISQWICGTENTNTIVQAVCDFGWVSNMPRKTVFFLEITFACFIILWILI